MDKKDIQRQSENVYDISEYGLLAKPVCMYINDLCYPVSQEDDYLQALLGQGFMCCRDQPRFLTRSEKCVVE